MTICNGPRDLLNFKRDISNIETASMINGPFYPPLIK